MQLFINYGSVAFFKTKTQTAVKTRSAPVRPLNSVWCLYHSVDLLIIVNDKLCYFDSPSAYLYAEAA